MDAAPALRHPFVSVRSSLLRPTLPAFALALAAAAFACTSLEVAQAPVEEPTPDDDADGDTPAGEDGAPPASKDGGTKADGSVTPDASGPPVCTEATCPPEVLLENLFAPVTIALDATHYYWIEVGSKIPQGAGQAQLARLPKATVPTAKCKADRSCFDVLDYFLAAGEFEGQSVYSTRVAVGTTDVCITQSYGTTVQHAIKCYAKPNFDTRVLDQGAGEVSDLWVGGTEARWAARSSTGTKSDGFVAGRKVDGGTLKSFATARPDPNGLATDGTSLAWTERRTTGQGALMTLGVDGGANAIATGLGAPLSPRLFDGFVYWIDTSGRKVLRRSLTGAGAVETLAPTDVAPFALAVDATGVYWGSLGGTGSPPVGTIQHVPTTGGVVTTMVKDIARLGDLAVDGTHVYWSSFGPSPFEKGRLSRIRKLP